MPPAVLSADWIRYPSGLGALVLRTELVPLLHKVRQPKHAPVELTKLLLYLFGQLGTTGCTIDTVLVDVFSTLTAWQM